MSGYLNDNGAIYSLTFAKIKSPAFVHFFIIYIIPIFSFSSFQSLRWYYCITVMMLFQRNPDLASISNFYVTTSSAGNDQPIAYGPGSIINGNVSTVCLSE